MRGLRSLMRRLLAGGGPSRSERVVDESMPSVCDEPDDGGGDGYAMRDRSSGGGVGERDSALSGELARLMSSLS